MCWVDCLHFFNRAINLERLSEFANQEFKWGGIYPKTVL